MENNSQKKYEKNSDYYNMVTVARFFGINTTDVKRDILAKQLNEKRDQIGHKEFDDRIARMSN